MQLADVVYVEIKPVVIGFAAVPVIKGERFALVHIEAHAENGGAVGDACVAGFGEASAVLVFHREGIAACGYEREAASRSVQSCLELLVFGDADEDLRAAENAAVYQNGAGDDRFAETDRLDRSIRFAAVDECNGAVGGAPDKLVSVCIHGHGVEIHESGFIDHHLLLVAVEREGSKFDTAARFREPPAAVDLLLGVGILGKRVARADDYRPRGGDAMRVVVAVSLFHNAYCLGNGRARSHFIPEGCLIAVIA